MEKIENILYSIVPLVLIILFSWLFSVLGSKMRKTPEGTDGVQEKGGDYRLIDMLTDQKPPPREATLRPEEIEWANDFPPSAQGTPQSPPIPGGPQVTPRPIRPKWWGA